MSLVRVLGIIQARMSSRRLPGKVGRLVLGKPLLAYLLERVRPARTVGRWVVATSQHHEDDAVERICAASETACFRGSLDDVLDRFYACARHYQPAVVVRLTADCPLHHFEVVDRAVARFHALRADYFTNSFPPLWEDGFDTEVFRVECLERAWRHAHAPEEREHVTLAIRTDPHWYREFQKLCPGYDYKLSVDTQEELAIVSRIIETFYPCTPFFTMRQVVGLVQANPTWGIERLGAQVSVRA